MKKMILGILSIAVLGLTACDSSKQSTSKEDTTSTSTSTASTGEVTDGTITFEAANKRYSAEGAFKEWSFSKFDMEKGKLESIDATITINLNSIWEKNAMLTKHLKAPDFFHVEKYTTATIDISNVKQKEGDVYTADMQLNMKDLVQDLTSEFTVTSMKPLHIKGTASVSRKLFQLGGEGMGVGEFVKVSYDTDLPN